MPSSGCQIIISDPKRPKISLANHYLRDRGSLPYSSLMIESRTVELRASGKAKLLERVILRSTDPRQSLPGPSRWIEIELENRLLEMWREEEDVYINFGLGAVPCDELEKVLADPPDSNSSVWIESTKDHGYRFKDGGQGYLNISYGPNLPNMRFNGSWPEDSDSLPLRVKTEDLRSALSLLSQYAV
jgi:hypothetical protein